MEDATDLTYLLIPPKLTVGVGRLLPALRPSSVPHIHAYGIMILV